MSRYFNTFDAMSGESLEHHGVLGMKWGVRHYRNSDGTYNDKGKKRYGTKGKRTRRQAQRYLNDLSEERNAAFKRARIAYRSQYGGYKKKLNIHNGQIWEPNYRDTAEYKKARDEQVKAFKEINKTYKVSTKNKLYVDHFGSRVTMALGGTVSLALMGMSSVQPVAPAVGLGTTVLTGLMAKHKIHEENNDIGNSMEPTFKVRRRKQSR
jgi:hypothetical protein